MSQVKKIFWILQENIEKGKKFIARQYNAGFDALRFLIQIIYNSNENHKMSYSIISDMILLDYSAAYWLTNSFWLVVGRQWKSKIVYLKLSTYY